MKPLVFFKDRPDNYIREGHCAIVTPINHPGPLVTNTKPIVTTRVLKVWPCGGFDTKNTRYRKEGYTGKWARQGELNAIEDTV